MIAIGNDHAGYRLKGDLIQYLEANGYPYLDCGTSKASSCDYPDFALKAAEAVISGKCELGIVICGTGIGISIAANKVKGIRCALCHDVFSAKATRQHNNANMLAMGERVIGPGLMLEITEAFLKTPFSGEDRHQRRIDAIARIETKYFK